MDLTHNYHELDGLSRLRYWIYDRWRLKVIDRFFFEGHRSLAGQMYLAERKALYMAIVERKPLFCYEIGTASGGGSTFFIANAFRQLHRGKLITLESLPPASQRAAHRYATDLKRLKRWVDFLVGESPDAFLPHIHGSGSVVECFFLDGSDTPEQAVAQYNFFLPFVRPGTILMAHDWNGPEMSLLRPLIEADPAWQLRTMLGPPVSVGFVVYARLG